MKKDKKRESASERLHNSEDSQTYGRKVEELLGKAKVEMEDNACVSKVFKNFKEVQATERVIGYEMCRREKEGTAWWTQEI